MIPEAAVEAAAGRVAEAFSADEMGWVNVDNLAEATIDVREFDLAAAIRAALEAAAPHMAP